MSTDDFFRDFAQTELSADLLPTMKEGTKTVRYTPFRYSGWRRWWRRLTFRAVESPTYEFEALMPGSYQDEDIDTTVFTITPVSRVRRVDP